MQALDPPEAVFDAHLGYLDASQALRSLEVRALELIDAATDQELVSFLESDFGVALNALIDGCFVWQDIADQERLDVDVLCPG